MRWVDYNSRLKMDAKSDEQVPLEEWALRRIYPHGDVDTLREEEEEEGIRNKPNV